MSNSIVHAVFTFSQSVQICCHEIRMALDFENTNPINEKQIPKFVTQSQLNGFFLHFEEVLDNIGYLKKIQGERLMQRIRLLFNRTQLDKDEINIMRGIFTEIQKKIK